MAFLPYPVIDLYIRAFVNGSQPYSEHRYFIDLRPNTPGHLWLGFALSSKGTVAGADSRLQRAVSVAENTFRFFQRSIKGSVSGRYSVIPLLGISVRKAVAFPSFYLFAGKSHAEFICDNVSLHYRTGLTLRRS